MTTDIPVPTPSEVRAVSVGEHAGGHSAISHDAALYRGLYEMTKEGIERAFSGEHGDEREEPDAWHRMEDTR